MMRHKATVDPDSASKRRTVSGRPGAGPLSLPLLALGAAVLALGAAALPAAADSQPAAGKSDDGEVYSAEELYEIYQMYIDAHLAQEVRDATRQMEILRKLAERRPRSAHVRSRIAAALLADDRMEEALKEARAAVELAPEEFEPRQVLGQALFHSNRVAEAGKEFERALGLEPNDYLSLLYLGEVHELAGEHLEAATVNIRLAYLRPNQAWQHQYKAAENFIRAGAFERATDMLERVVVANPAHAEAYVHLGHMYQQLERWADAIRVYREIIGRFRFRDAVADAHVRLSEIYYRMGESEEAEEELQWVVENRPSLLAARRDLGILRYYGGDYDGAIELLTDWVTNHPEREGDAFHLARAYQQRSKQAEAKGDTAAAVADASAAAYWYGCVLDRVPDHGRALAELKDAIPPERAMELMERYDAAIAAITAHATDGQPAVPDLLRQAVFYVAKAKAAEESQLAGVVPLATGARESALRTYQTVLEKDPASRDALEDLADLYQEEEDWANARMYYIRLLETDPEDVIVLYRTGYCELQLREYEAAAERFRSGLGVLEERIRTATEEALVAPGEPAGEKLEERYRPLRGALAYYLGVCRLFQRDLEAAEEALRQAVAFVDDNLAYVDQLAVILLRRERLAEAEALLREALADHPGDPELAARLAQILQEQGKYSEALELLENTVAEHPEDTALRVRLAAAHEAKGDLAEAESILEEAIQEHPEDENLYLQLAFVFEKQKAIDRVEEIIQRLLEVHQNSPAAFNFLGYTYADHNVKLDEAYDLIKRALAVEPHNGMYVDSLGWVYYRQGKYLDAARELRRAVDLIGDDPVVLEHLGDALHALGQTDEAVTHWKKALEIDPNNEALSGKIDRAKQARQ